MEFGKIRVIYFLEQRLCIDAKFPATASIKAEQVQTQGNMKVSIKQIVITNDHTRVFVEIENLSDSANLNFYDFNTIIIQDKKQMKSTYLFGLDYNNVESNIPSSVIEDGYVILDPIQPKSFKLILKGSEQNNDGYIGFGEHTFEFNFDLE